MPKTYKEALSEEIEREIARNVSNTMGFMSDQVSEKELNQSKKYLLDFFLSKFDQHLERLAEKVEGMKPSKSDFDSETSKSNVWHSAKNKILSVIKSFK